MTRRNDLNVNELVKLAEEANARLDRQQPKVNALTLWLENRKNQNGFGADFEFSLTPKVTR